MTNANCGWCVTDCVSRNTGSCFDSSRNPKHLTLNRTTCTVCSDYVDCSSCNQVLVIIPSFIVTPGAFWTIRFTVWAKGKVNSGLVNFILESHLPCTQISSFHWKTALRNYNQTSTNGHLSTMASCLQHPLFCLSRQSVHWLLFKPLYSGHCGEVQV